MQPLWEKIAEEAQKIQIVDTMVGIYLKLLVIFLERTIIAIPLIVLFANLLGI